MSNGDLLEELRELVDCPYISDLRCDSYCNSLARKFLSRMDIAAYSFGTLKETAEYIYASPCEFTEPGQAKKFFAEKER